MRNGFYDIRCDQNLEAEQERSANSDLVNLGILPGHRPSQMDIGGPGDPDHDDEDAENLNRASDYPGGVIAQRFDSFEGARGRSSL